MCHVWAKSSVDTCFAKLVSCWIIILGKIFCGCGTSVTYQKVKSSIPISNFKRTKNKENCFFLPTLNIPNVCVTKVVRSVNGPTKRLFIKLYNHKWFIGQCFGRSVFDKNLVSRCFWSSSTEKARPIFIIQLIIGIIYMAKQCLRGQLVYNTSGPSEIRITYNIYIFSLVFFLLFFVLNLVLRRTNYIKRTGQTKRIADRPGRHSQG